VAALLAVLAPVPARAIQSSPAPLLPLEAAVSTALKQNRQLQIDRLEADRAAQELAAARTRRRPVFDVTVLAGSLVAPLSFRFPEGVFGTFASVGPVPPADTKLTTNPRLTSVVVARVIQPLTQLRRIGYDASAADLGHQVVGERVRAREADIAAAVRRLYYGIVQAEAGLRAREQSVRLHRELARVVEQYAEEERVLPAEVLSIRVGLMQQQLELASLGRAALGYREQLNALLGRELDEAFAVEPLRPIPVDEVNVVAAEAEAVAGRPEVRIGRLQSQQAAFDFRASAMPGLPDVSVAFNYAGFYGFDLLPRHGAQLGLMVSWEPWDWGRRKAERERKRLAVEQAGLGAREAETRVRIDVRARTRDVQDAFERARLSDAAREAARERLRVVTERFRREAALERDLLEAQTVLAQAEFAGQQALEAYWTARAELERARASR
jgi:outer membrane protein TolC